MYSCAQRNLEIWKAFLWKIANTLFILRYFGKYRK